MRNTFDNKVNENKLTVSSWDAIEVTGHAETRTYEKSYLNKKITDKTRSIADDIDSNFDKIRKFVSNEKIKQEILKMLLMPFSKNSFILIQDNNIREKNILISSLEKWWSAEKYIQGKDILEKCKKKFNVEKY